ncbi:response regulator transcription factor [Clostridium ihumii]|uniref:response regulator transcription factor n=1 Tax=Clostridium ihumii TaxID=1470356 RepID=UPI000ACF5940|nr:response regulator transcription factor [Clostridium ihumii]
MMCKKVLIIDDNEEIISFIKPALECEGFTVDYAITGYEALSKINSKLNIILLDVMLPDLNGFDICKKIRESINCPIIFLTARGLEEERVKGFLVGGDDYIVKPFSLKELILRINIHFNRTSTNYVKETRTKINFNDVCINLISKCIEKNNTELDFTKKEYEIIELFSTHPSQVFSKEQIFELLWGYDSESNVTTVTEHIKRIRLKFKSNNISTKYIKTAWGIGYKWDSLKL